MSRYPTVTQWIRLPDEETSFELKGCTLVVPEPKDSELAKVGIWCPDIFDLGHLVQWAFDHGYGLNSLTLTIFWNREMLEEDLGRRMSDQEWEAAQAWLDRTDGGHTACRVYSAHEGIQTELTERTRDGRILDYRE